MNYTMKQFSELTGLTIDQVKMSCYRRNFDCHITKHVPIQRGGAKRLTLVEDTPRTMAQVQKLIDADRAGKFETKTIKLKSGLEVSRCALGYVMAGE